MKTNQYMNTNAKNITEAVNHIVAARILEIRSLVAAGWTKDAAIAHFKETTTLGQKSIAAVLDGVA